MATKSKNSERIDFRLAHAQKTLIEQAALARGQTVSDFAKATLVTQANQTLQEVAVTRLSKRDRDVFLAMLDDDSAPNEALRRAAKRYRQGG